MSTTGSVQEVLNGRGTSRPARLIPVFKESQRELRAVSLVLATLPIIPDFARDLLAPLGYSVRKTSKIECATEVNLKNDEKRLRPDGLITVTTRRKPWHAFVEAKVGKEELGKEQIEHYLQLARDNDVDAVITISNQFCIHPAHHPVHVDRRFLRSVQLYHLSWTWLLAIAQICARNKKISDTEQAYILKEIIHFLKSEYSGVEGFTRMPREWTRICDAVRKRAVLRKTDGAVRIVADAWREMARALSLRVSSELGVHVESLLTREQKKGGYETVRDDDCGTLCKDSELQASFAIPHVTAPVHIAANILGRTIVCSMRIQAPQDKKRASAAFTWLLRQLTKCTDDDIRIVARWGRRDSIEYSLRQLRNDRETWSQNLPGNVPKTFEIRSVRECEQRFTRQRNLVQETEEAFRDFYEGVARHIESWRPKPPPLRGKGKKDAQKVMDTAPPLSEESAVVGAEDSGQAQDSGFPHPLVRHSRESGNPEAAAEPPDALDHPHE